MKKRIISYLSLVLTLVMLASALFIGAPVKAEAAPESESAKLSVQEGLTLHCWNWSFEEIEANMEIIASLGYTSIQTSPIQQAKQGTKGFPWNDWWVFYQPASFSIDESPSSALGTKASFESMCEVAHKYGIYVIVDVVANHMGNNSDAGTGLADTIDPDLLNDSDCWHDITKNTSNYSSRYEVTQYCMAGLPDLNTANDKVQQMVLDYLKECVDAGADGFRFDAVKHIETPDDGDIASDFWPTVIDGIKEYDAEVYCYGELLDSPGGSLGVDSYTKYMSVTDNTYSNGVLSNVVGGNASGITGNYHKGSEATKLVLWAESHDTYADGSTADVSEENINKAWALIGARADAMSLYLARPANSSQYLGAASDTAWAYPEVAAVNHFHNRFVGKSEYVANENGIAYVERGDSGVVLVNMKGAGAEVSVTAHAMADGTYTDAITGSSFTVSGGKISGTIGDTGIAVVYDVEACAHENHDADGFCKSCLALVGHEYDDSGLCACGEELVGNRTIYFTNSGNWTTVNVYSWYDPINIITTGWPGDAMTAVEDNIYSCVVPLDAPYIIFNDGTNQTDDLEIPALSEGLNMYDFATGSWGVYGTVEPAPGDVPEDTEATDPVEDPTVPEESVGDTEPVEDQEKKEGDSDAGIIIAVVVGTVVILAIIVVIVIMAKKGKK